MWELATGCRLLCAECKAAQQTGWGIPECAAAWRRGEGDSFVSLSALIGATMGSRTECRTARHEGKPQQEGGITPAPPNMNLTFLLVKLLA